MLNERQQEAVNQTEGPVLILAGAGAGKTKTITERIVNIITKGVSPHNILAVTFTNKAAKEMRERVEHRLQSVGAGEINFYNSYPTIKTFHSLGLMILRENYIRAGLTANITILDTDDQRNIIKGIIEAMGLDVKIHEPGRIKSIISIEKGNFNNWKKYKDQVANYNMEIIANVWRAYEEELKNQKAVDFDDLIVRAVNLLKENPDIQKKYQERFKYIHIDEYQDTNEAQYNMTMSLVDKAHNNICVVGDTDQNIYSWRGANLKNIMKFEDDFKGALVILLEENYRSTSKILNLANRAISKNKIRKEKNLFTKQGEGDHIKLVPTWNEVAEANYVAEKCKELLALDVDPNQIAVLYRANFQSRILEEGFLKSGVPYNMLGVKFFERKEVKDVLSYLRAALNRDSHMDLKRVFENPKRGIGKVTLAKFFAREELSAANEKKINDVMSFLDKILVTLETETLSSVIQMIIVDSGMERAYKEGDSEDRDRLENTYEVVSYAQKYDEYNGLDALNIMLEETSLQSDQDNDDKSKVGVRLMTVHASKGLEFEHVFVVGLEHDLFPHKNIGGKRRTQEEEEEERRLFYVAVTRAKKNLYLTYTEIRTIFGQKQINAPSVFLEDLDENETDTEELYYGDGGNTLYF